MDPQLADPQLADPLADPLASQLVVGVDPGIRNLGFVVGYFDGRQLRIHAAERVDLTRICRSKPCLWPRRSKELFDRLQHLRCHSILGPALRDAAHIIVERQPPGGLVSVSDFFLSHWRDKTCLVSPNAMHAHFGINQLSYDGRKCATESIAADFIDAPVAGRRHDVADALCLLLFWTRKIWRPPTKVTANDWMEKFGFQESDGP